MRAIAVITAGAVFVMGLTGADAALARAQTSHPAAGSAAMKSCAAQWQEKKKAGTATGTYKDFSKTCMSGKGAAGATEKGAAGAAATAPAAAGGSKAAKTTTTHEKKTTTPANTDATNATAKCKDGTYSHAATHSGACSGHGGVAQWLK